MSLLHWSTLAFSLLQWARCSFQLDSNITISGALSTPGRSTMVSGTNTTEPKTLVLFHLPTYNPARVVSPQGRAENSPAKRIRSGHPRTVISSSPLSSSLPLLSVPSPSREEADEEPPTEKSTTTGSVTTMSHGFMLNTSSGGNHDVTPSYAYGGRVSATEPYIDPVTPSRVTAYTGVTAILSCFVNNLGQRSVSWVRHRDIHVLTVGGLTFTNDDRFLSHHEDGSNEWALRLRSPKTDDSGHYECQVNTKPIISRLVFLRVLDPKAVMSGGQELYVKLGSAFQLNCTVVNTSSKPDFLLWHHNEKVISSDGGRVRVNTTAAEKGNSTGSILRISSASGRDSGTYTCSPSNARNDSVIVHVINGEHPAAMQTNGGNGTSWHFNLITLALFLVPRLMEKIPNVARIGSIFSNKEERS